MSKLGALTIQEGGENRREECLSEGKLGEGISQQVRQTVYQSAIVGAIPIDRCFGLTTFRGPL